uniref:PorT family protein n=1 Tax=Roseihalotalea indica TaxID=2867963 RepID=A0AA49GSL3_9BACT|nr:PorT family protein [Tunicatimonas sp. TK19036]
MNDKDFDALFKRAAEQHRVPYNPNAWAKMRRKLDGGAGWWGTNGKITLGIVLLLLIGGVLGTYFWSQDAKESKKTEAEVMASQSALDTRETEPIVRDKNLSGQLENVPLINPEESEQPAEGAETRDAFTTADVDSTSYATALVQGFLPLEGVGYLSGNSVKNEAVAGGIGQVSLVGLPVADDSSETIIPTENQPKPVRWRISMGISPDISAINLGEASQVGSKASVGLEYFITPKLSIQTGVIFSNKLYQASGESYKPYPGYWKKYPMPNSIDAHCDVLDIPINMRYYGITMPKSRIYLSGGVSSYLMLTEDYVYHYKGYGYQKPYDYKHHERNKNRHYFKVANISLGYERALGKRWALQVEPFVKVPVAGVGFGKIRLSTTGMFMSLNYRLR